MNKINYMKQYFCYLLFCYKSVCKKNPVKPKMLLYLIIIIIVKFCQPQLPFLTINFTDFFFDQLYLCISYKEA